MTDIHLPLAAIDAFARGDAQTLARETGLRPWQVNPLDANDGPSPWPGTCAGAASWPHAQRVRRALEKALADRRRRDARL